MTPGARAAAAIEILGAIAAEAAPADVVAGAYLRARRYIGAKDRAAIAAMVYGALRHQAQLDWWLARAGKRLSPDRAVETARGRILAWLAIGEGWTAEKIGAEFSGEKFRPAALGGREAEVVTALAGRTLEHPEQPDWVRLAYPQWLEVRLKRRFGAAVVGELSALAGEAPLDLRVNPLKGTREQAAATLATEGIGATPTALSPLGLRVRGRPPLTASSAYRSGLVEVQDEGSQLAALLVDAQPEHRVCDFCAGAGGKTLAMAARMANRGHIVACDVSGPRLEGAAKRLRRAGVHNVERRNLSGERDPWVKRHRASFDRVLIDAPCTGTGTWRRNPNARWTLTPADLAELVELQSRILESASRLVKPGGRLVYVTCSLLADENEDRVTAFLGGGAPFRIVPVADLWPSAVGGICPTKEQFLELSPARDATDGFFIAILERTSDA